MVTLSLASLLLGCGSSMSAYTDTADPVVHQYRVVALSVVGDPDPDGDGEVNNFLPEALDGVAAALPEQGLDVWHLNERIAHTIDELTPLFVEAAVAEGQLGLRVANGRFDESGAVVPPEPGSGRTLAGAVDPSGAFQAGPGDLVVEVSVHEAYDPVPFELAATTAVGTLDETEIIGTIYTRIPIDSVVEDVIEPTVPEEGWDLNWDGELEPKDEVMALVEELAPLAADVLLPDGSPAISAILVFAAEAGAD